MQKRKLKDLKVGDFFVLEQGSVHNAVYVKRGYSRRYRVYACYKLDNPASCLFVPGHKVVYVA